MSRAQPDPSPAEMVPSSFAPGRPRPGECLGDHILRGFMSPTLASTVRRQSSRDARGPRFSQDRLTFLRTRTHQNVKRS
jgi:hypothetical protein